MESQGAEAVAEQVEQAGLEEAEEEEEPGEGEDFRPGDWCRAEWSQDGVVYEAVIESMNKKKGTARVRYLGFNNQEEKELEELYLSKGEEWRGEQELGSAGSGIREDEIHNLIAQNCPDLLANFGGEGDAAGLDLDKLTIQPKSKPKKSKKEPSVDRSLHEALTSEFSENQVTVETLNGGEGKKAKGKKTKETKERSAKKPPKPSVPTSLPASWDMPPSYSLPPMAPFPSPGYPPAPMMPPMASPMMPPMMAPMFPQQMPPPMQLPVGIPPPPVLEGMMEDQQVRTLPRPPVPDTPPLPRASTPCFCPGTWPATRRGSTSRPGLPGRGNKPRRRRRRSEGRKSRRTHQSLSGIIG
jgi:hypothetical protein